MVDDTIGNDDIHVDVCVHVLPTTYHVLPTTVRYVETGDILVQYLHYTHVRILVYSVSVCNYVCTLRIRTSSHATLPLCIM